MNFLRQRDDGIDSVVKCDGLTVQIDELFRKRMISELNMKNLAVVVCDYEHDSTAARRSFCDGLCSSLYNV